MLHQSDVGFVVLSLKDNVQTVCYCRHYRQVAIPSVVPLTCSDPERRPETKELQLEAERMLRDKPYSPLPGTRDEIAPVPAKPAND